MPETGLLGVGQGVIKPDWSGQQDLQLAKDPPPLEKREDAAEARDARIVKDAVTGLVGQDIVYSQVVDLASIAANSTVDRDISTTTDKVIVGDTIVWVGCTTLNHGLVVQGCSAPSNDTIRIRISNLTAAAIDPASATFHFVIKHPLNV